jgi:hypothetical protein
MLIRLTAALVLAISPQALAPTTLEQPVTTEPTVECSAQQSSGKSAEMISPSGARAFVTVSAKSLRRDSRNEDNSRCTVTWILHIGGPKESLHNVIVLERDDLWSEENTFDMIGWSRDGTRLLAATVIAAGDADETTPVVYDIASRKLYVVPLESLFAKIAPKDCPIYFRPLGFTPAGRVIVSVGAFETPYLDPGQKPCFAESSWELDYRIKRIRKASPAKAEHFGTVSRRGQ